MIEGYASEHHAVKRAIFVNLSVLLLSVILCALVLEVASRILFEAPPSVVVENLSDPAAKVDLLPLLREKYEQDGADVFYDHCRYGSEGDEYFAKAVADFLLRELISG